MTKPAPFLDKYKIILFDMDGVMTSEQRYWDSSALTIYEYLNPDVNPSDAMAQVSNIRENIFQYDKSLIYLKDIGVNSNWDTTYIILSAAVMLGTKDDFKSVYDFITSLNMTALEMYEYLGEKSPLGKRGDEIYNECVYSFQEWYLGDKLFQEKWNRKTKHPGKEGLLWYEEPVIPLKKLINVVKTLSNAGFSLGIGTGRVNFEIELPLEGWGIRKYFDENRLITYTEVMEAEKSIPNSTLTKPNPYMFIKGMLGKDCDDKAIVNGTFDKSLAKKTLVVGDAGADMFAAQAANISFAAVLTGVSGQKAREYFIDNNADFILNDLSEFVTD